MLTTLALISMLALERQADVRGPATLCFAYSRFSLRADEVVEEVRAGMHGVTLDIAGPSGRYRLSENEVMRTPTDLGVLVRREHTNSLYRSRRSARYGFVVMAPDGEHERMLVVLEGSALSGSASDAAIYDRVQIGLSPGERCDRRYLYGL
ncbi:MAG: hypothetical protein EON86_18755 [Brevundimonas sp.]|nr:MAG: hypothetical protein EON86_18755 [Brevundimonas sp.]